MSGNDLIRLIDERGVAPWRMHAAKWIESPRLQAIIIGAIILNGVILGLETSDTLMTDYGALLIALDQLCLLVFVIELGIKLAVYRMLFWKNGWNWFDFFVVAIALAPGTGPWAVLRSLRILRVLRLLTVVPQLRKVVAAFIHAIPGLTGVILVMLIFFYTMGVLATNLFGEAFPEYFGTLGDSLFSLFQIMTLVSWSMGIVRPVMEVYPWAWAFFVPFIVVATFTILNLFIGIIVSTMQELSTIPDLNKPQVDIQQTLTRMEDDLARLKQYLEKMNR